MLNDLVDQIKIEHHKQNKELSQVKADLKAVLIADTSKEIKDLSGSLEQIKEENTRSKTEISENSDLVASI